MTIVSNKLYFSLWWLCQFHPRPPCSIEKYLPLFLPLSNWTDCKNSSLLNNFCLHLMGLIQNEHLGFFLLDYIFKQNVEYLYLYLYLNKWMCLDKVDWITTYIGFTCFFYYLFYMQFIFNLCHCVLACSIHACFKFIWTKKIKSNHWIHHIFKSCTNSNYLCFGQ